MEMTEKEIAKLVVDGAFRVHAKLGSGIFETVYEATLAHELRKRGLKVAPVHKKQLLTYLCLTDKRLGLLINFGEELIKNGITHVVNGLIGE
jgi:hypothetical protein